MNTLFKKQEELQAILNADEPNAMNAGGLCNEIRSMAFFLNQEVVELIEEIGGKDINKPWKVDYTNQFIRRANITPAVKSEAIDVLKFAMNICLKAGIDSDNIDEEFNKVHTKNLKRIKDGY